MSYIVLHHLADKGYILLQKGLGYDKLQVTDHRPPPPVSLVVNHPRGVCRDELRGPDPVPKARGFADKNDCLRACAAV